MTSTTPAKPPYLTHYLTGLAIGLDTLEGFLFDPHTPYTGCRICGALYQSDLDRTGSNAELATEQRRLWSFVHSRTHTDREHENLAKSGKWCTPEAAYRMAAFGVITLDTGDEYVAALYESKPIPVNDVEGV